MMSSIFLPPLSLALTPALFICFILLIYILFILLSFRYLHSLVQEALSLHVPQNTVALVHSREEIGDLCEMSDHINLIIPRGGKALVTSIQNLVRQLEGKREKKRMRKEIVFVKRWIGVRARF